MKHMFINRNSNKTFIILHGTGGDESDLVGVSNYIDDKANVLGIRGNVVENGMNRFFKRLGMGIYDINNYILETTNLKNAILKYIDLYNLNKDNITVIGFSNGANIALGLIQEYPELLNNYILLSNDYINSDKGFKDLSNLNIFISSSLIDPYINFSKIEKLIKILKENNSKVTLEMVDGHKITKELLDKAKIFYEK